MHLFGQDYHNNDFKEEIKLCTRPHVNSGKFIFISHVNSLVGALSFLADEWGENI